MGCVSSAFRVFPGITVLCLYGRAGREFGGRIRMARVCPTTATATIWSSGSEPFDRHGLGYIPPLYSADLSSLSEPHRHCCDAIPSLDRNGYSLCLAL